MGELPKKKVYVKTFLSTSPSEIDKAVNEFRDKNDVIAIQTNIALGTNTNLPLFHYVVFYKETKK